MKTFTYKLSLNGSEKTSPKTVAKPQPKQKKTKSRLELVGFTRGLKSNQKTLAHFFTER